MRPVLPGYNSIGKLKDRRRLTNSPGLEDEGLAAKINFKSAGLHLDKFAADALAGVTVGLVALRWRWHLLSHRGCAAGGTVCAIVAGFLISALGDQQRKSAAPQGFCRRGLRHRREVWLRRTVHVRHAGVFLVVLGATGLGTAVKFIPLRRRGVHEWLAVLIAAHTIKDFFRPQKSTKSRRISGADRNSGSKLSDRFTLETSLGVVALVMILVFMRYVNGCQVHCGLFGGYALVMNFKLPVETIGTRLVEFLPVSGIKIPHFHFEMLRPLISPAITVAMLGAIESLMSRRLDRMSGNKQIQRRTGGPGHRQHFSAALWRFFPPRSDCANRHEYPFRSEDAGRRYGARIDAPGDRAVCRAAGAIHFRSRYWRRFCSSFPTTWGNGGRYPSF